MKFFWAVLTSLSLVTGVSVASEADETVVFDIDKMTCATCPIAVRQAMKRVDGVKEVTVSLEDNSAVVTFDPDATTASEIGRASTDVGFPATMRETE